MFDSGHGLFFTIAQEHGLVGSRFIIIIHPVISVTACDLNTAQSPRVFEGSLDGVHKFLMVTMFPQMHQWLPTAWSSLFADITYLERLRVHDCRVMEKEFEGTWSQFVFEKREK